MALPQKVWNNFSIYSQVSSGNKWPWARGTEPPTTFLIQWTIHHRVPLWRRVSLPKCCPVENRQINTCITSPALFLKLKAPWNSWFNVQGTMSVFFSFCSFFLLLCWDWWWLQFWGYWNWYQSVLLTVVVMMALFGVVVVLMMMLMMIIMGLNSHYMFYHVCVNHVLHHESS